MAEADAKDGLGHLEEVEPREIWPHEAHDFTPWLLANADRLAEALGIDLELDVPEHPVGGFSLDLLGRDISNNGTLIVENQLAGTDHSHLGQLLTYAAGTRAVTIVWIATGFREEHRQALDWLNETTGEETRFFGIKIRVVRIGESVRAPLFELVTTPNNWQKHVRASARETGGGNAAAYERFWALFLERLRKERPTWSRARTPSRQSWFSMVGPVRGTQLNPSFAAGGRLRSELYIDTGEQARNQQIFELLVSRREALEAAYGRPLEFEALPTKRAKKVAEYRPGAIAREDEFGDYVDFFFDSGDRMRGALEAISFAALVDALVPVPLPDPID